MKRPSKANATAMAAALAFAATAASAAIWTGGASGVLNTAANWDGDIATTAMAFTNDVALSLSSDVAVYDVFWNNGTLANNLQKNRNVAFNLNGHTLTNLTQGGWCGEGSTFTFSGGTFLNVAAGGTTNELSVNNGNRSYGLTLVATGADTVFVSSLYNRARNSDHPDVSFRFLDHARAYGDHYSLGGHGSTNEVSGGSSLTFDTTFTLGSVEAGYRGHHDNLFRLSGGTLAARNPNVAGTLYVANNGAVHDNFFLAENGATVTVYAVSVGINSTTNNTMRLTGRGTRLTQVPSSGPTSWIGNGAGSVSNRFVVADGAVAVFNRTMCIGTGSSIGNLFRVEAGGIVTNANVYFGHNNGGKKGECARSEVVGAGSEWKTGNLYVLNATDDASKAHELFVGDGGSLKAYSLRFFGKGNRFVVDDATAVIDSTLFTTNAGEGVTYGSDTSIKISGARASITCNQLNGADAGFEGSEVVEFVIPPNGWNVAPFAPYRGFKIPSGLTLRIDADSVKAYLKANPTGGTVPLMRVRNATSITVEDMPALSANLPQGCELVNAGGVLSVRIKAITPTVLSIR